MPKLDLKKENKELYNPSAKGVSIVDIPEMSFLMIDGEGDPNKSQEYQGSIEALFSVSFKVKFLSEKENVKDYVVMPLEGLWWAENMENFSIKDKSSWKWTSMIRQPDFITQEMIKRAIEKVNKKKDLPSLFRIRFENLREGLSAQILHIGSYAEEGPAIEKLHNFIEDKDYEFDGSMTGERHHEIYLNDARRAKPEKLKTIIRQPIKRKS